MTFRYRIHNKEKGKLLLRNIIQLSRSFIINKEVLGSGILNLFKEARLLSKSVRESKVFYNKHKYFYSKQQVDFLT